MQNKKKIHGINSCDATGRKASPAEPEQEMHEHVIKTRILPVYLIAYHRHAKRRT